VALVRLSKKWIYDAYLFKEILDGHTTRITEREAEEIIK
jgi:hypothetical protein